MEYKVIKLTQNKETFVEADDCETIRYYKWHAFIDNGRWRAKTTVYKNKKRISLLLSRLIMGCPKNKEVDHINRNTLDNRKQNLRIVTRLVNAQNRLDKGYFFDKSIKKWKVYICTNLKRRFIGSFDNPNNARRAYLFAKQKYHGITPNTKDSSPR